MTSLLSSLVDVAKESLAVYSSQSSSTFRQPASYCLWVIVSPDILWWLRLLKLKSIDLPLPSISTGSFLRVMASKIVGRFTTNSLKFTRFISLATVLTSLLAR